MTQPSSLAEEWAPEVLVRVYRGGHLIEQRFCGSPQLVAEIVESRQSLLSPTGELIVVEPHPPEMIVELLRAIADAIEQERPVTLPHPFPHIRLQVATEGSETTSPQRGELRLLWQEMAHPGG